MAHPLILISNPKSGDGQGHAFVEQHVLPLVAEHDVRIDRQIITSASGHAGLEFLSFVRQQRQDSPVRISLILSGGDGTLHEIIDAIYTATLEHPAQVSVALVPSGTANALYSSIFSSTLSSLQAGEITPLEYKLYSVKALLRNQGDTTPLTITKATVRSPSGGITTEHFSAVVTSTALHASILHDSESLREQVPDLSRFKIAAEKNILRWYPGIVTFRAKDGGEVTIYDQHTGDFVQFLGDDNNPSEPSIHGPFAYFLSTVNVDRLEPSFVISPLQSKIRPETNAMDITIIRPHRDPTIRRDSNSDSDHERFAEKVGIALRAAYQNGAQVELTYSGDGSLREASSSPQEGSSRSPIEYVRCTASWRWHNTSSEPAHLCIDGTVVDIEAGAEVECQIIDTSTLSFGISI